MREIYFRYIGDSKWDNSILEVDNEMEALIYKIYMILLSNRGEVLGEPYLGLDLERYLFESYINKSAIQDQFYSQVGKYIPESGNYKIDMEISDTTDGYKNEIYIDIKINDVKVLSVIF